MELLALEVSASASSVPPAVAPARRVTHVDVLLWLLLSCCGWLQGHMLHVLRTCCRLPGPLVRRLSSYPSERALFPNAPLPLLAAACFSVLLLLPVTMPPYNETFSSIQCSSEPATSLSAPLACRQSAASVRPTWQLALRSKCAQDPTASHCGMSSSRKRSNSGAANALVKMSACCS